MSLNLSNHVISHLPWISHLMPQKERKVYAKKIKHENDIIWPQSLSLKGKNFDITVISLISIINNNNESKI